MEPAITFVAEQDSDDVYNARAVGYSIFTFAATIDELREMIRDAVLCHFFEEDATERAHHPSPSHR